MKYLALFILFFAPLIFSNELEKKFENFILNNPEIILKSLEKYEQEKIEEIEIENKKKISESKELIVNSKNGLYLGNPNGKKVIVEFFDYNCSYCKKAHEDIKKLSTDQDVKIIFKNFPILSERSIELAKLAIVIGKLDNKKFNRFHEFIFTNKSPPSEKKISEFLSGLDLDYENLKNVLNEDDVIKDLEKDVNLARDLKLRGTPAFIINEEILSGYVGFEELKSKILN